MPDLMIHHQNRDTDRVGFDRVYKIKKGQEQSAIAAAKQNGLDDVLFRMSNGDVFIASRSGVPGSVEPFDQISFKDGVSYGGLRGEVISIDEERNTVKESQTQGLLWGLTGWVGGTAGLTGLALKFLNNSMGWSIALVGGLAVGAVGLLAGVFTGRPKIDYDKLAPFAERVDGAKPYGEGVTVGVGAGGP